MDIYKIRKRNLRWIIDTEYQGIAVGLARDLGMQPNTVSRVFVNSDYKRNIGNKFARKIERGTKKPHGWLDQPHFLATTNGLGQYQVPGWASEIVKLTSQLPPSGRSDLLDYIRYRVQVHQRRQKGKE